MSLATWTSSFPPLAVIAAVFLFGAPAHALAQEDPAQPEGTWGLRFALPGGAGGTFGAVYFVSGRTSLGLDMEVGFSSNERDNRFAVAQESTSWSVGLTPELRHFFTSRGIVAPFVLTSASLQYGHTDGGSGREDDRWIAGARVGLGAEWFPVERIGISGSTGVRATYQKSTRTRPDPPAQTEMSGWGLGDFRSALFLSFYF